ncbi:MAG: helix-turn-helix domain-containing protein [Spirochaetes bacterium]|nr:helix-turn-helix domain-containing protein [Spirochaetota bacterium]
MFAVLLLAGAAVALVLAYTTNRRSIEQGFSEQARAALDGMVRTAQGWLEIVESLQSQAPLDRDIRRYLVSRKAGSADAIIRLEDAIAGMRARIPAVRVLENLAVYLVDEDILITSLGAEEPRYFFDRYVYEVESDAEIDSLVRDEKRPALFTRRVTYEGAFSLIAIGRNSRPDQRRVTTIAHLKPQYLLPEQDPGEGAFIIWSPEAGLLASRGAAIEPDVSLLEPGPATGRRIAAGGRWFYLYTARDEQTGWIFAHAAPEAGLAVPLRRLGLLTLLIALGVLSAAALIAFLVTSTVYRPVDAVLHRLFPDSQPEGLVDEFEAIGGLFSQLRAQNVRLSDVLSHARPTLQEHTVRDIVSGRISADEMRARLEEADLSFNQPLFTVVVLSPGGSDPPDPELLALMGRAVVAHARALLGGWTSGIAETDDEKFVVLINHDDAPDQRARIRTLVREIQESVHRQLHVVLTGVVGSACGSLAELHRCYREAVRTLETAHLWPPGVLVTAEDAAVEGEEASYTYPVERERSIINAAVAGDFDYATRGIVAVLEANLVGRSLRADACGHLLTAVAGTIVRICHRLHVKPDGLLEPGRDIYDTIAGTQGWEELKRAVESICSAIAATIARERKQHDDRLRDRFREYIQGNYQRNISLFDMAEAFSLTPSYLSELFKERMGENYIDYLTAFRMEVARNLLTGTSAKVNDVATESGYANVTSFIRVFKKHEGVSPGAYRALHQRIEG